MNNYYKLLIISILCFLIVSCKSTAIKEKKIKNTDDIENSTNTDDLRDEQMNDLYQDTREYNN